MTAYERLTDALSANGVAIRAGRSKQDVKCPGHEDKTASLSISQGREGAVVYCHAGCPTDAVLAAIGLKPTDLFDEKKSPRREIVKTYDYTKDSELRSQVVRYAGKTFSQRQPNGRGGWIWNIKGVDRILYRHDEVAAAVKAGELVVVAEGEKDSNRVHAEGLIGTEWPKCDSSVLDGGTTVAW